MQTKWYGPIFLVGHVDQGQASLAGPRRAGAHGREYGMYFRRANPTVVLRMLRAVKEPPLVAVTSLAFFSMTDRALQEVLQPVGHFLSFRG